MTHTKGELESAIRRWETVGAQVHHVLVKVTNQQEHLILASVVIHFMNGSTCRAEEMIYSIPNLVRQGFLKKEIEK